MIQSLTNFALILLLLPALLIFLLKRSGRKGLNLPPGPVPLPFIGNLLEVGHCPHISFLRLSKRYGPILYLKLGAVPAIVISSPKVAADTLKAQDGIFGSRPVTFASYRMSYGGLDIGFSSGERSKQLRRFCNAEMFSSRRVESFRALREEESEILMSTIRKDSLNRKTSVNMSSMFLCFFNNIFYREVFGKRISPEGECRSTPHHDLLNETMTILGGLSIGDLMPSLRWVSFFSGWNSKLERVFTGMDRLFEEEIDENLKERRRSGDKRDGVLLDTLLQRQVEKDPLLGSLLTREEVKALLMDMFVAASETSASAIEWAMTELMRNPKILKKAQEEVRRVMKGKGSVTESDLQSIPYVNLVLKEVIRLHPPSTVLPPRESVKKTQVCGYNIPAKTRLFVNVWAIGRDPEYWVEPESFCPERFLNSSISYRGNNFELLPFGAGRRICPGMDLAVVGIELVLANLLHVFDWDLPNGMTAYDINMEEKFGLTTRKKIPLILVPKPVIPSACA